MRDTPRIVPAARRLRRLRIEQDGRLGGQERGPHRLGGLARSVNRADASVHRHARARARRRFGRRTDASAHPGRQARHPRAHPTGTGNSPATKPTPTPTPESEPATDQPQSPAPGAGGPATTGVIMSPTGHFYRAGEFCPTDDLGKSTVDSHGTAITCGPESGANHWHY